MSDEPRITITLDTFGARCMIPRCQVMRDPHYMIINRAVLESWLARLRVAEQQIKLMEEQRCESI